MPKKVDIRQLSGSPLNWKENNYESEYVLVLPTHGDGHYLGTEEGSRPVDTVICNKLRKQRIVWAIPACYPNGALLRRCVAGCRVDDPGTQRLKFLVALRPSVTSPTVAPARPPRLTVSRMVVRCLIWYRQRSTRAGRRRRVP